MTSDAAFGCGLAALFVLVAFVTTGGTDLGPNTWMEIAAALLAAAAAAAVIVIGAPGRAWGGVTLLLFAALAALTFASIAWSVQPDNSWVEANRTVAYLAAFGTAIALARLLPERWPAVLGAVATAATVLSAWALLVKVFPAIAGRQRPGGAPEGAVRLLERHRACWPRWGWRRASGPARGRRPAGSCGR